MEARTSSFDEVTRPNQMLDSTAATALKNILPLKHRHLVQEEHPYTQYVFSKVRCDYMNDVKNRNQQEEGIVSKLVSRVSLHDVHAFRQETLKSLNEYSFPIGTDAKQTDLLKCFETRPEEISGLYYIVKRRKTDLLLCAVHREMAAEDRHDLKVVKLTPEATDVLNEGRVRLENYYVGDVVLVFTMTPTCVRSRILEVDPISTFKDDFAPSWSVRKFGLVHRNIEQILAAPLEVDKKKGTILLTGENKTRLVHGKLDQFPADFKMDQVFEVSVLVPLEHCERLTTHYRDPENIRHYGRAIRTA
ncbi:unnamed protein product [Caenorhabditis auriculariae]|uniref:Uncharacterized protein n=1 Tax=Caenorhabditis auriculariae TaxID=2777116 RepID=A0A8S1HEP7_9PELO|nr:unnamed protein product [Caenorhabditis auriculariae]